VWGGKDFFRWQEPDALKWRRAECEAQHRKKEEEAASLLAAESAGREKKRKGDTQKQRRKKRGKAVADERMDKPDVEIEERFDDSSPVLLGGVAIPAAVRADAAATLPDSRAGVHLMGVELQSYRRQHLLESQQQPAPHIGGRWDDIIGDPPAMREYIAKAKSDRLKAGNGNHISAHELHQPAVAETKDSTLPELLVPPRRLPASWGQHAMQHRQLQHAAMGTGGTGLDFATAPCRPAPSRMQSEPCLRRQVPGAVPAVMSSVAVDIASSAGTFMRNASEGLLPTSVARAASLVSSPFAPARISPGGLVLGPSHGHAYPGQLPQIKICESSLR